MSKMIISKCKECGKDLHLPYWDKNSYYIPSNLCGFYRKIKKGNANCKLNGTKAIYIVLKK